MIPLDYKKPASADCLVITISSQSIDIAAIYQQYLPLAYVGIIYHPPEI